MLGDDTQHDGEVYREFARIDPDRVLAIYIHVITGEQSHPGATLYYTPFEVAVREFQQQRLSQEDAASVGQALLDADDDNLVIPDFAVCPKNYAPLDGQALAGSLATIYSRLKERVIRMCTNR